MPLGEELGGGKVAEGLVWADVVVDGFPLLEPLVEGGDLEGEVGDLVELLGMGAVGAFDAAVELGGAGRQGEQEDAAEPALGLELGHELRSAVDLEGADREGHARLEGIQEEGGRRGGGAERASGGARVTCTRKMSSFSLYRSCKAVSFAGSRVNVIST